MHILLAYGEVNFMKNLKAALTQKGHQAAILPEGDPPKARYDLIFQLAHDPAQTAEGTRLLLNKVRKDQSRLFLVGWRTDDHLYDEAFRFARTFVEEAEKQGGIDAVTFNLGRLFGPGVPPSDSGALGHLISEFSEGNILTLYGEGKDSDHYLYLDDAVESLAMALGQAKSGEVYALAPSIPITSEAAAHLLYDLGGGRHEIIFHRGLAAVEEKKEVAGKPLPEFKINTPFHDGIVAILKTTPAVPRAMGWKLPNLRAPLFKIRKLKIALPRVSGRVGIALAGILIVLSPVLYLGGNASLGVLQLQRAKTLLEQGDFAAAATAASSAAGSLERFGKIIPPARPLAEAVTAVAEIAAQSETLITALDNLVKSRRGEATTPQSEEDFRNLGAAFSSAQDRLTLAWLENQQEGSRLWQPLRSALEQIFEEGLKAVRFGEGVALGLPDLLGYKGERSYLLLFQNSAELQPGGGRMGTFAQLTLENGGIKDLKFFNESDFKHVSSPLGRFNAISKLPDFTDGARAITDIFLRGSGKQVQGVIGVDLRFAQELLGITGPLVLTDFDNQEVTTENFFEVTTREVETDFFPGTTKKKRFIQALGEAVIAKLFAVEPGKYAAIGRLTWDKLESRGLLLYLGSSAASQAVVEAGFGGMVEDPAGDYLLALTHNAGTKGTVWVTRDLTYRILNHLKSGTLRGVFSVTWHNNGLDSWPAGTYEDLFRVLVPQGSQLVKAQLEEADVTALIRKRVEHGKTSFEYRVKTAAGTSQTLVFTYDLPSDFNLKNISLYRLFVQKQAGAFGDRLRFTFEKPLGYEITGIAQPDGEEDLQNDGENLTFEGSLERDLNFVVEIKER